MEWRSVSDSAMASPLIRGISGNSSTGNDSTLVPTNCAPMRYLSAAVFFAGALDEDFLAVAARLAGLEQFVVRDEQRVGFAGAGLFQADGDVVIEIRPGKGDPAVLGAFEFDVAEHGQGAAFGNDFAEAGEGGFEFRDG